MSEHEANWVDIESWSGQDDTAYLLCSCGWRSRSIWSRFEMMGIERDFSDHKMRAPGE